MNLVLIGYRGSGKTSVARRLADTLKCQMIDTDELIADEAGMSIADIFERENESGFRAREREAVKAATAIVDRIISVGGGAVESPENRRLLGDYGTVVWLDADPDTLWRRIRGDAQSASNRPDLTGGGLAEVESVVVRRRGLYESLADIRIDTAKLDIDTVADLVMERIDVRPG